MSCNTFIDGIHEILPRDKMSSSVRKLRDAYGRKAGAPIYQREFGFYCMDRWKQEGYINDKSNLKELFGYDEDAEYNLGGLGWCEAAFCPVFEEKIIEDRGDYEVVQDFSGRHLLCFKGRRQGFMPEYLDHPVKDIKSWEANCKWRMNPKTLERYTNLDQNMNAAKDCAAKGMMITQRIVGGYMYLRSLIGPLDLLYTFYDNPALIHDCMETWLKLADEITSIHQRYVTIDELFIGEDICYNHGPLISPDMINEFLLPYYQQLITNIKSRQIDKNRHLYFQVDTDGFSVSVIPLYSSLGMDVMSPFEVASGCNVVDIGIQYPNLILLGGVDKRVLAKNKDAIDRLVDRIFPAMKERGGYIPTCDHGVPEEVSFENYMYYRKRCLEF